MWPPRGTETRKRASERASSPARFRASTLESVSNCQTIWRVRGASPQRRTLPPRHAREGQVPASRHRRAYPGRPPRRGRSCPLRPRCPRARGRRRHAGAPRRRHRPRRLVRRPPRRGHHQRLGLRPHDQRSRQRLRRNRARRRTLRCCRPRPVLVPPPGRNRPAHAGRRRCLGGLLDLHRARPARRQPRRYRRHLAAEHQRPGVQAQQPGQRPHRQALPPGDRATQQLPGALGQPVGPLVHRRQHRWHRGLLPLRPGGDRGRHRYHRGPQRRGRLHARLARQRTELLPSERALRRPQPRRRIGRLVLLPPRRQGPRQPRHLHEQPGRLPGRRGHARPESQLGRRPDDLTDHLEQDRHDRRNPVPPRHRRLHP